MGKRRPAVLDQPVSADKPIGNRKVIPTTCSVHRGARGFTNLAVTKREGEIMLDPHVTGECVIILDEAAATALFDVLGEWLG